MTAGITIDRQPMIFDVLPTFFSLPTSHPSSNCQPARQLRKLTATDRDLSPSTSKYPLNLEP